MALGCLWAQQGLSALGSMTSGLLTGAEANKITKEPFCDLPQRRGHTAVS